MYKINKQEQFKNTPCIQNRNYQDNNTINEDIHKMHLLPPHCPMTPKSYTDFFNDNTKLSGVAPYTMKTISHPRQGYIHSIEYRDFYSDFKKDALHYTSQNNQFINNNNNDFIIKPHIINDVNSENVKLYKETKPHNEFAKPMKINGSNKVSDLFDNCMNKNTFEYKRFSNISPHNKQWIDNPIFTQDITEETNTLKNNYMDNIDTANMNIYSSIFEDMYYLSTNIPVQTSSSEFIQKIEKKLANNNINNITNDSSQTIIKQNINILDTKLQKRNNLRSEVINPIDY